MFSAALADPFTVLVRDSLAKSPAVQQAEDCVVVTGCEQGLSTLSLQDQFLHTIPMPLSVTQHYVLAH